jgi:hypothetical protein
MPHNRKESDFMSVEYWLSTKPYVFVGTKPEAVLIDGESIPVKTWRMVYKVILQRCIENPVYHKRLMALRGRLSGQQRVFISARPDGMSSPLEICEGLYAEVHYGSETLMHILTVRVLNPIHYDYSKIKIRLK